MKKRIFCILFFATLISSCSSIKGNELDDNKDKLNALNDYLETQIKTPTKEIIIIEEKINSNETIEIFKGDSVVYSPTNIVREGGIDISLYNEKDWVKMKKKYYNHNIKEKFLEKDNWKITDFRIKNISIENRKTDYESSNTGKYFDLPSKDVYYFSEPIYYKNKKTLIFSVSYNDSRDMIGGSQYKVIVMKKKKDKWLEIGKATPPWII